MRRLKVLSLPSIPALSPFPARSPFHVCLFRICMTVLPHSASFNDEEDVDDDNDRGAFAIC